MIGFYSKYFNEISSKISMVKTEELHDLAKLLEECQQSGRKIIIAGNGGSSAIASHVSVDLTKAAGIRAINFNEADLITCFSNDYGYENWVSRALASFGDPGDILILVSSSGQSRNMLNAASIAKSMNIPVVTFSGFLSSNPLRSMGKLNFWVDSDQYNIVEMTHHIWLLAVVDNLVELKNA